jgi:hypothetical protein
VSLSTICPCGIHRDDCDYHKPAPESEPVTLRAATVPEFDTQAFVNALAIMGDTMFDSEPPTVRFGTYSSSIVIDSHVLTVLAHDPMSRIAEKAERYWAQRMNEILDDWAKAYFS